MRSYLNIMHNILENGEWKDNRTGKRCLTVSHQLFTHYMGEGFPLLTQKKVPFKTMCVELEGFLKGITSKKWYQDRGCHIWDEWANPVTAKQEFDRSEPDSQVPYNEHNRKLSQEMCDDLGTFYSWQWRRFGQASSENCDGILKRIDQIQNILDQLLKDPNDRRMLCISWCPFQLDTAALPACHFSFGLTHINGKLDLAFNMRSWDFLLGAPFNIASYAILLMLFAKHAGLKPNKLSGFGLDVHLYEDHIKQAEELVRRKEHFLPTVEFTHNDFWDWDHTKIKLINYKHSGVLKADVAV